MVIGCDGDVTCEPYAVISSFRCQHSYLIDLMHLRFLTEGDVEITRRYSCSFFISLCRLRTLRTATSCACLTFFVFRGVAGCPSLMCHATQTHEPGLTIRHTPCKSTFLVISKI